MKRILSYVVCFVVMTATAQAQQICGSTACIQQPAAMRPSSTLKFRDAPLEYVLKVLEASNGMKFDTSAVNLLGKSYTGNLAGMTLLQQLQTVLNPHGLRAEIRANTIFVFPADGTYTSPRYEHKPYGGGGIYPTYYPGPSSIERNMHELGWGGLTLTAAYADRARYGDNYYPWYGSYSPSYGYGQYGFFHPEPCAAFPSNRACVMGKVQIDLQTTLALIQSMLRLAGLPLRHNEVDMYTARINEQTGEQLTIPVNEGPVTKANNWFQEYRIEAGTYRIWFIEKRSGRKLFEDQIRVRPEYYMGGKKQFLRVSNGRFADEISVGTIQQQNQTRTAEEFWRR